MSYYSHNEDPILDPMRCVICDVEATDEIPGRRISDDEWACSDSHRDTHERINRATQPELEEAA